MSKNLSLKIDLIIERLRLIEQLLELGRDKESYTVGDVAKRLGKSEWTVRRWLSLGQAKGTKWGRKGEWRISPEELARLEREGAATVGTYLK